MNTYFIRHSEMCDIGLNLRERLWSDRKICIHYEDLPSSDPNDYSAPTAKRAIALFNKIASEGGYVCATIYPYPGCLVGVIKPGSIIEPFVGGKQSDSAKNSTVKTLRLMQAREVPAHKANRLLIGQPQQGTLTAWKIVGNRVRQFVEHGDVTISQLTDLLPFEQEVMCSEYLRIASPECGLPRMAHLSAPVGRTRKAIDVAGVTLDGQLVFAQVTHHSFGSQEITAKATALREAGGESGALLIIFCRARSVSHDNGVHFHPLEHVFAAMKAISTWRIAIGITEATP